MVQQREWMRAWGRRPGGVAAGLLTVALLSACSTPEVAIAPPAAPQDGRPVSPWQLVRLPGKSPTHYEMAVHPSGRMAWHATADHSASMWRHPLPIPASELGRIRFSWWVDALLPDADLAVAGRTDASVRIVLGFDGDHSKLSSKQRMLFELASALGGEAPPYASLVYTWANQQPVDSIIVHPRLDRIRKLVVESGPQGLGRWREHERDVRADYRRVFGEEPGPLLWVALMTDSDNVQGRIEAWYGEVSLGPGRTLTPR